MEVSSPDADAIARVKRQATAPALPVLPFFPCKFFAFAQINEGLLINFNVVQLKDGLPRFSL